MTYIPFSPMIERPRMAPYHKKNNFLSEGVRFGAKSKLTRMGVYLVYIPIRGNELGDEDDPLSQENKFLVRRVADVPSIKKSAWIGSTWRTSYSG